MTGPVDAAKPREEVREYQHTKILRMRSNGFTAREIQRACNDNWPTHPIGLTEVRLIIQRGGK